MIARTRNSGIATNSHQNRRKNPRLRRPPRLAVPLPFFCWPRLPFGLPFAGPVAGVRPVGRAPPAGRARVRRGGPAADAAVAPVAAAAVRRAAEEELDRRGGGAPPVDRPAPALPAEAPGLG